MKLSLKDIILIAAVAVGFFIIFSIVMLFVSGTARIEINRKEKLGFLQQNKLKYVKQTKFRDSLILAQSQSYLANEKERQEIEIKLAELEKQKERINILTQELKRTREELALEREKFEKLVAANDELENKRIRQLAKVYGAMRANEAARILETLNDDLLIKIISAIGDDRQKAKIMASLSQQKASIISRKMGKTVKKNR